MEELFADALTTHGQVDNQTTAKPIHHQITMQRLSANTIFRYSILDFTNTYI